MRISEEPILADKRHHSQRSQRRRRRFQADLVLGLRQVDGPRFANSDKRLKQTLVAHGLDPADVGVHSLVFRDEVVHVLGVSNRVWYSETSARLLSTVLRHLGQMGHRFVSIPQRAMEALDGTAHVPNLVTMLLAVPSPSSVEPFPNCGTFFHPPSGCAAVRIATGRHCWSTLASLRRLSM